MIVEHHTPHLIEGHVLRHPAKGREGALQAAHHGQRGLRSTNSTESSREYPNTTTNAYRTPHGNFTVAKSHGACSPGAVSKRSTASGAGGGRSRRTNAVSWSSRRCRPRPDTP